MLLWHHGNLLLQSLQTPSWQTKVGQVEEEAPRKHVSGAVASEVLSLPQR